MSTETLLAPELVLIWFLALLLVGLLSWPDEV
jgi:hypothetical protein